MTMAQSINVSKVRCIKCRKTFKAKKVNILHQANDCPAEDCALRSDGYKQVMFLLRKKAGIVDIENVVEYEVPDPIGIEIDSRGRERTLS